MHTRNEKVVETKLKVERPALFKDSASQRPIRVLHLCQRDDPATGGAVQVATTLVQSLREIADIDARLVFLYGEPGSVSQRLGDCCKHLRLRNSRDVPLRGSRLIRHMLSADIVHHHDMLTWTNCASLCVPGIKRIMHGHIFAGVRSFRWRAHVASWVQTRRLSKLIAITEEVRESWLNAGVSDEILTSIGNVVDFARFRSCNNDRREIRTQLGISDSDIVVGSVGRLHNIVKGTDDFVRTVAKLPANFHALIVGDGPDLASLMKLAETEQIEDRVHFLGSVDDPERYYSAMDIFLFTSHFDGFALTPLEAIAAGIPVFALQCDGGFNEWASDELIFRLDDRDCDAMAALIQASITSGAAIHKAQQAQAIAMKQFDASVMANDVANVYREIMGREPVIGNAKLGKDTHG